MDKPHKQHGTKQKQNTQEHETVGIHLYVVLEPAGNSVRSQVAEYINSMLCLHRQQIKRAGCGVKLTASFGSENVAFGGV